MKKFGSYFHCLIKNVPIMCMHKMLCDKDSYTTSIQHLSSRDHCTSCGNNTCGAAQMGFNFKGNVVLTSHFWLSNSKKFRTETSHYLHHYHQTKSAYNCSFPITFLIQLPSQASSFIGFFTSPHIRCTGHVCDISKQSVMRWALEQSALWD